MSPLRGVLDRLVGEETPDPEPDAGPEGPAASDPGPAASDPGASAPDPGASASDPEASPAPARPLPDLAEAPNARPCWTAAAEDRLVLQY